MSENILFCFDNHLDRSTVAASSEEATLPVANLQDARRSKKWRSGAVSSAYIDITRDVNEDTPVSMVAIIDHNISPGATIQLQGWSAGLGSGAPDIDVAIDPYEGFTGYGAGGYGQGGYGGAPSASNRALLSRIVTFIPLPDQSEDLYWRITFNDPSLSYIQAGRIYLGGYWQPAVNMSWGNRMKREGRTKTIEARGGQQYGNPKDGRTILNIPHDWLDVADWTDLWMHCLRVEDHTPFIVCVRPTGDIKQILTAFYGRFNSLEVSFEAEGARTPLTIEEEL